MPLWRWAELKIILLSREGFISIKESVSAFTRFGFHRADYALKSESRERGHGAGKAGTSDVEERVHDVGRPLLRATAGAREKFPAPQARATLVFICFGCFLAFRSSLNYGKNESG